MYRMTIFYGTDTFTYEVTDDKGDTATATVTMDIQPVNDNPVAMDDQMRLIQTEQSGLVGSMDVIANDADVDNANEELFITAINGMEVAPEEAVYIGDEVYVFLEADGRTLYYSDVNYEEPLSFDYTMADGSGGFDTATVQLGCISTIHSSSSYLFCNGGPGTTWFPACFVPRVFGVRSQRL